MEIFKKESIVLGAAFADKWEAIRACGKLLVAGGYVHEAYIDSMLRREEVASVYAGNGVAIPHGTENSEKNIIASGLCFIQVPGGVVFGENTAHLIMGIAGKDGTHAELLGRIAIACSDMDIIEQLCSTDDPAFVYDTFAGVKLD